MKPVKFFLLYLGIGLSLASSCKRETENIEPVARKFYPTSVTRTANYTTDTLRSDYSYNAENQIVREDVFRNRKLQGYNLITYNAAGKPVKKTYHEVSGQIREQEEITYNAANQPDRLSHAYMDAAGQPTPHHYRVHEFDAAGKITRWTDFMPAGTVMSSRTYTYPASGKVSSPAFNNTGQLTTTSDITLDANPTPFQNTTINLVPYAGNELKHDVTEPSGKLFSTYTNTLVYNEAGFPEKITQVHADGVIKTEVYTYKTE